MNVLGEDRQRPAAVITCTLPGLVLLHQGQMEGKRERLPVQRAVPLQNEPENASLREFYRGLLRMISAPVFVEGGFAVLIEIGKVSWRNWGARCNGGR